jgi:hypothetical protein
MKAKKRDIQRRIAYESARILTEYQSDDQIFAMQKAAGKLGITDKRLMPNREEVDLALREQQRLFRGNKQQNALMKLRHSALEAMQALNRFNPLLVGAVYEGTADSNSRVVLHLFCDTPEDLVFALSELHIPWHERERHIKFRDGSHKYMPSFQFTADDILYELIVFTSKGPSNRPTTPIDNRPIQGANIKQLKLLLNQR